MLTVDCVALGFRINEFRNSFTLPVDVNWPNIESKSRASATATGDDSASYGKSALQGALWVVTRLISEKDTELNWDNVVPWLRQHTNLPIWVKGGEYFYQKQGPYISDCPFLVVSTPEDVVLAIQYGVDGVIVSNHGGRQLDGVPATLDSLRDCVPAAAGKIPIAIDGGIRRGSDSGSFPNYMSSFWIIAKHRNVLHLQNISLAIMNAHSCSKRMEEVMLKSEFSCSLQSSCPRRLVLLCRSSADLGSGGECF